jgi:hypothetical protein
MVLLLYWPLLVGSVNIAIDFGSAFVKSCIFTETEPPQLWRNSAGAISTPAFISFRAKPALNLSSPTPLSDDEAELLQAEIGDRALATAHLRPWLGSGFFTAFAGLSHQAAIDKAAAFCIRLSAARIPHFHLLGVFLKVYANLVANSDPVDHIRLALPASFTSGQRLIFESALNGTNFSIIDDVDAVARNYMARNTNSLTDDRKVLFVDVGATSVKAFVIKFEIYDRKPVATRLSYSVDYTSGGAFVTAGLVSLLKTKLGITETTDGENRRLFTAAERIKIDLSDSQSSGGMVENISGIDRSVLVARAEFESQFAQNLAAAAVSVAVNASRNIRFDELELLGGSSRVPIVVDSLKKALGVEEFESPSVEEAIAVGAGIGKYEVLNRAQLFQVEIVTSNESIPVCTIGQECLPEVPVRVNETLLTLTYSDGPLMPGITAGTQQFRISRNVTHLRFERRPVRLIGVDKCIDECVPGKFVHVSPPEVSVTLPELITSQEARVAHVAFLRNETEQLSVRVLKEIEKNATIRGFTNHTQRLDIIRCAEKEKKWIKSPEAEQVTDARTLGIHLATVRKCIAPVYHRLQENETFWAAANKLHIELSRGHNLIDYWEGSLPLSQRLELNAFETRLNKTQEWFNTSLQENMQANHSDLLPHKPRVFLEKYLELHPELVELKARWGKGGARLKRADGKRIDAEQLAAMGNMDFLEKMGAQLGLKVQNTPDEDDQEDYDDDL